MAVLSPMTDLQAVNRMLASIGQAPVNSLAITGIGDVAKCIAQLAETTRDVQTVGYSWNMDGDYKLTPDPVTGFILFPAGALEVDPTDSTVNVVVRRNPNNGLLNLYDVDNQRFTFPAAVGMTIVWGYEFNDLPPAARSYIATAAARRFQAQTVSSVILDRFNEVDELRAYMLLQRHERRVRDTNSFRASSSLRRWSGRRNF